MRGFDYLTKIEGAPTHYRCQGCGARGVKLWRDTVICLQQVTLLCKPCAEAESGEPLGGHHGGDQIGYRLPAVPDIAPGDDDALPKGYTFWGYTSVPQSGLEWWNSLQGEGLRYGSMHRDPGVTKEQATAFAAGILFAKDLIRNETMNLSSRVHFIDGASHLLERYAEITKGRERFIRDRMARLIKEVAS